jgi:hypothetical protein
MRWLLKTARATNAATSNAMFQTEVMRVGSWIGARIETRPQTEHQTHIERNETIG